jgi:uncharacterized integral membrane protein
MENSSGSFDAGQDPEVGVPRSPVEQSRSAAAVPERTAPEQVSRPSVGSDPRLDEHQRQGITGATWIALILGALILVMLLIFILQNNVPADFAYLGWTFTLPLGVAMLFAAIGGVLVMALFGSVRLIKQGHRVRRLEKERETIKRTIS